MTIEESTVAGLPKVLLHDHLDGGLRPETIVELAAQAGHELPTTDPAELGAWFVHAASSGTLELYLETFSHTVAVMQTEENLRRVAREAVLDLAADGVEYAEQRYAPEQHLEQGLSLLQVVEAVQAGFAEGVAEAAAGGRSIRIGTLITAMRQAERGDEIAGLALAHRADGVVGFDIAGPEEGFAPSRFTSAFRTLTEADFPFTIHAGEGSGLESIAGAVHLGASRLGHGARIVDDIEIVRPDGPEADVEIEARFGLLAHWVRDHQLPLELCPSSNVQTGVADSIAMHPITLLKELGFAVTINTDNRLQSGTSLTREMTLLANEAGWTMDDLRDATLTAAWNAFIHHDEREELVEGVILPAFTASTAGRHRA